MSKNTDTLESAKARAARWPLALNDLPPDQPVHLADVARAFGWRTQRTRRILFGMNRKHEEPVAIKSGGRWMLVSVNRLRQVWQSPERGLTVTELTELLEESRDREKRALDRARDAEKQMVSLRARQRATEQRMVQIEESFERATSVFLQRGAPAPSERPTPVFDLDEGESGVHRTAAGLAMAAGARSAAGRVPR